MLQLKANFPLLSFFLTECFVFFLVQFIPKIVVNLRLDWKLWLISGTCVNSSKKRSRYLLLFSSRHNLFFHFCFTNQSSKCNLHYFGLIICFDFAGLLRPSVDGKVSYDDYVAFRRFLIFTYSAVTFCLHKS